MKLNILITSLLLVFNIYAKDNNFTIGTLTENFRMTSFDVKIISLKLASNFGNYKKGETIKALVYGFDKDTGKYSLEVKDDKTIQAFDLDLSSNIKGMVYEQGKLSVGYFLINVKKEHMNKVSHILNQENYQEEVPNDLSWIYTHKTKFPSLFVNKGQQFILSKSHLK